MRINCPECKEQNVVQWPQSPKYFLLGGWRCPNCGYDSQLGEVGGVGKKKIRETMDQQTEDEDQLKEHTTAELADSFSIKTITMLLSGINSTIFGLLLIIAVPLALFSPIVAFWCGDDRGVLGIILAWATLVIVASWPVVILYSIAKAWSFFVKKAYKKAIYFSIFPWANLIIFLIIMFLDSALFGLCRTPVE